MTKKTHEVPAVQAEDFFILTDGQLLGRLLGSEYDVKPYRYPYGVLIQLLWCNSDTWVTPFGEKLPRVGVLDAALDVVRNVTFAQVDLAKPLRDPQSLARYLFLNHSHRHCDTLVALYLDEDGGWIDDERLLLGDGEHSQVRQADILRPGLEVGARGLIIAHVRTHGDHLPTKAELERTHQVRAAATVLGMTLVDSWIVTCPIGSHRHIGRFSAPPVESPAAETGSEAADPAREAWVNEEMLWRGAIPLATVLSRGRLSEGAMQSARKLLQAAGGPAGLVPATLEQLTSWDLTPEQIDALQLTLELGRRLGQDERLDQGPVLWSPQKTAGYLVEHLAQAGMDAAGAIFLDERRAVLGHCVSGEDEYDLQGAAARGILVEALAVGATQLVPFLFTVDRSLFPKCLDAGLYEDLYEAGLYFDFEIADFLYVGDTGRFLARSQPGSQPGDYQQAEMKAKKGA